MDSKDSSHKADEAADKAKTNVGKPVDEAKEGSHKASDAAAKLNEAARKARTDVSEKADKAEHQRFDGTKKVDRAATESPTKTAHPVSEPADEPSDEAHTLERKA
ncbi:MAG: hypothetical protein JNK05_37870 [Myxococcales bacterium]|nr:hypothetical protein [Myxococcales bacterium]